jgi:uncharacterized BrkB/YihY/UPF0761 family membrane protein
MSNIQELASNFFGKFSYRGVLAVLITVGCFTFLFALLYVPIPRQNESAVNVAQGFVLSVLAMVAGYYFGSSKDKSDVDKANNVSNIIQAGTDPKL